MFNVHVHGWNEEDLIAMMDSANQCIETLARVWDNSVVDSIKWSSFSMGWRRPVMNATRTITFFVLKDYMTWWPCFPTSHPFLRHIHLLLFFFSLQLLLSITMCVLENECLLYWLYLVATENCFRTWQWNWFNVTKLLNEYFRLMF